MIGGLGITTRPNPSRGFGILLMGIAALLLMLVPRLALAQTGFPDVRTLCHPVSIQGDKPEERPCLQQLRDVMERNDSVLTLKLDNGKAKVFKSNVEACERGPDGCVEYRLAGYIESDRQFVVQVLQYEYSFVNLVSRRNGNATKLEDWPHLSPNNKRFVVVAASDAWDIDDAIAVFSAATDPPQLLWKFPRPHEYEQYSFDGWDGEGRVLLLVTSNGDTATTDLKTDLKLTAQGWQVKRPNGQYSLGILGQANPQRPANQPANAAAPVMPPGR